MVYVHQEIVEGRAASVALAGGGHRDSKRRPKITDQSKKKNELSALLSPVTSLLRFRFRTVEQARCAPRHRMAAACAPCSRCYSVPRIARSGAPLTSRPALR